MKFCIRMNQYSKEVKVVQNSKVKSSFTTLCLRLLNDASVRNLHLRFCVKNYNKLYGVKV